MDLFNQLTKLNVEISKLKEEKEELIKEVNYLKEINKESVHRYRKAADELLFYYARFGKPEDILPTRDKKHPTKHDRK